MRTNILFILIFIVNTVYSQVSTSEFLRLKQIYDGKLVITLDPMTVQRYPLSERQFNIDAQSVWKCKILISPANQVDSNSSSKDSILVFILSNKEVSFTAFNGSYRSFPSINMFFLYDQYTQRVNAENEEAVKVENLKRNSLIKRFGKENGMLIYQQKVKIGMNKKMCDASWGAPSSSHIITTKSGTSEVCNYSGKGTLVFENGIVTKIVK